MNLVQPNLTERHKELAMTALQKEVNALVDQQQAMEPGYSEKKAFYEDIKQEFEALDSQMRYLSDCVRANQDAINVLKGLALKPNEEIRIVNITKEKKTCTKRVEWMKEIVQLLKIKNRPLSFEEIWQILSTDALIIAAYKGAVHPVANSKMAVLTNITNHLNNPKQSHYKQLYLYQRKFFGLPEWFDEKGAIKSIEHARNFNSIQKLA